jgi:hypothetical protein
VAPGSGAWATFGYLAFSRSDLTGLDNAASPTEADILRCLRKSLKMSQNSSAFDPRDAWFVFPSSAHDLYLLRGSEYACARGLRAQHHELPADLWTLRERIHDVPGVTGEDRSNQPVGRDHLLRRLDTSWTVIAVFREVMERAAARERHEISAAVERSFWNEHDGVLLHPWIRALLEKLKTSGREFVILEVERLLGQLHWAEDMKEARRWHLNSRLRAVGKGASGELDEKSVAAWEFLTDYFLMQRAAAEDVREASRRKSDGESTAARLMRMDAYDRTHFSRTRLHLSFPHSLLDEYRAGGDTHDLAALAEYGKSRAEMDGSVLISWLPGLAVAEGEAVRLCGTGTD